MTHWLTTFLAATAWYKEEQRSGWFDPIRPDLHPSSAYKYLHSLWVHRVQISAVERLWQVRDDSIGGGGGGVWTNSMMLTKSLEKRSRNRCTVSKCKSALFDDLHIHMYGYMDIRGDGILIHNTSHMYKHTAQIYLLLAYIYLPRNHAKHFSLAHFIKWF